MPLESARAIAAVIHPEVRLQHHNLAKLCAAWNPQAARARRGGLVAQESMCRGMEVATGWNVRASTPALPAPRACQAQADLQSIESGLAPLPIATQPSQSPRSPRNQKVDSADGGIKFQLRRKPARQFSGAGCIPESPRARAGG